MKISKKKQRGQGRRLKKLFQRIDNFRPYTDVNQIYEHFHVPCTAFIDNTNTSSKIKTTFIKKWIAAAERFVLDKPEGLPFCRAAAVICEPYLSASQIIIFYDEEYSNSFWGRNGEEPKWTVITNRSLKTQKGIKTNLAEKGFCETMTDGETAFKDELWFYCEP